MPAISNQTYGAAPITLNATASSGLPVTYSVISSPATVSGNTLTIKGVGTVIVAANQGGSVDYFGAPQVTTSFVVSKASQMITFPTVGALKVGQKIKLTAASTSDLPITYSAVPVAGYAGQATILGNRMTVTAAGKIKLAASQPGDADYKAATQVQ